MFTDSFCELFLASNSGSSSCLPVVVESLHLIDCTKWEKHRVMWRCRSGLSWSYIFSLTFQILLQAVSGRYLHNQKRTAKPRSCPHPLPCAMPKSAMWPGGVAMESLSNMDSAGSCDSVISMNSGCVSAAVDPLASVPLPLLLICWLYKAAYRHTVLLH